jgi:ATP-dependent helicase/nuclease subunit A
MGLTLAQQQAVAARGNVLVVAGAGTGKTSTLVERCIHCLLNESPRASLEEILMVTFTEAAAADMRQRIRQRLERELELAQANDSAGSAPSGHWQEQLALFETAHIGTLHGFCFHLVREHFYELELDPQLSVLPEEEARLLAEETLDNVLEKHYAGTSNNAEEVQKLIQAHGGGSDRPIRALVQRLHHYTQTLPDPGAWLSEQLRIFESPQPTLWEQWLERGLMDWHRHWLPILAEEFPGNQVAAAGASALERLPGAPARADFARVFDAVLAAVKNCPHGKKTAWLKPLQEFVEEARFLTSLAGKSASAPTDRGTAATPAPMPPLLQDWTWVRGQMQTLLELAREFTAAFSDSKHELGMVDYHDLEQYALRLLWDRATRQPSAVARQWREKLRFVFVDEYQDINAAQDRIIEALCREGADANRFLVGDVKQSIYRFRLANPRIFQNYLAAWGGPARADQPASGQAIPLADNFRSREGVLQFVNALFGLVMQPELGGVRYDEQAQLRFGAPAERAALSLAADPAPCVELRLQLLGSAAQDESEADLGEAFGELADMERAGKAARLLALRLRELKAQRHPVWDEETAAWRPVEWSDMAVLLRAPSNKADSYAREFSRLDVPLLVARGGFYDSLEISDLLNLLRLLDNPLQDLPLLAVLRSPLAGLSLDELATIRLTYKGPFWNALVQWSEGRRDNAALSRKTDAFLERYGHWRRLARQASLTRCLDTVLAETYYADWVLTQSRGEQRRANLQRLSGLVRQFDQFQRQGLFRFLRFIEAQQRTESEPIVPPVNAGDSVRLMSIHQSKGLEFPVVAVADLGKAFNTADLRADIILDEEFGLCPRVTPPRTGRSYPSLAYWLARQRQTRELLGEELRLLYVAMTRARDTLLLSAGVAESKFENLWKGGAATRPPSLLSARSYADWLGLWFARNIRPDDATATHGQSHGLRWFVHSDASLAETAAAPAAAETENEPPNAADAEARQNLQARLSWTYPFAGATRKPAKTSVSALRRLAGEFAGEEANPLFAERHFPAPPFTSAAARHTRAPAAEVGNAHHAFLQFVALERAGTLDELREEARRLQGQGLLTPDQAALLDFGALAAFWQSELGRRVRAQARFVRRELPFTARFSPPELAALTGEPLAPKLEAEFIVVQGVADLAVLLPGEIWLVDFKTDAIDAAELPPKVKLYEPQVRLYAQALSRIHQRRVSESWLYFLACGQAVKVAVV